MYRFSAFGSALVEGLPLDRFVNTARALQSRDYKYPFVDEDVTEPLGIAGSMVSWKGEVNHLSLVIDVGAGTTDIGLYRIRIDPKRKVDVAVEVEGSNRVLTEAGDYLDRLLIGLILRKAEISLESPAARRVHGRLNLRIREFKETLFNERRLFVPLDGDVGKSEVEIELDEFCELEGVRAFQRSVHDAVVDVLQSIDESWIGWVQADPRRALLMVLAGGGAKLPMVRALAERPLQVHGKPIAVQQALDVPTWLAEVDEHLVLDYPRVAVSLGGARKRLIKERVAKVTAGDVTSPPKIGGYYQKSGPH